MASGYQQTIGAGTTTPLPSTSPDEFGAGVGAAITGLGDQMSAEHQRMVSLQREQQQDQQSVDWANSFATAQASLSQSIADLRANAAPGGAGHVQAVMQAFDDHTSDLLSGITNPQVRRTAQIQLASSRTAVADQAINWQAGQQAQHLKITADNAVSTMANNAATTSNPLDWHALETQSNSMIDDLTGLDDDTKGQMKRGAAQQIYIGGLHGLINGGNPQAAVTVLEHGALNDVLTPEQYDTMHRTALVQVNRQAAQQREQLAQQKSAVTQSASLLKDQVDAGVIPDPGQVQQLAGKAQQLGMDKDVFDLGVIQSKIDLNTQTQPWRPQQYQDEISRLSALGDKATPADQVRLHQLQDLAPKRINEIKSNPQAWAATVGDPAPAIDLQTGDGLQARGAWAQRTATALGMPNVPVMSADEALPLQQAIAHGTAQQKFDAAHAVLQWGAFAPQVLDQVAPNDPGFRAAAALSGMPNGDVLVRQALNGADALKAQPELLRPAKNPDGSPGLTHQQIFANDMGQATALLPPAARAALAYNATNIYAAQAGAAGFAGVFHPGQFQIAERYAVGGAQTGAGWSGGLGTWQGQTVILPQGMTQSQFDQRISRAGGDQWAHASATPTDPPWMPGPNGGRPLHATELRGLTPVMVGDGRYALRQGNNTYITTKGRQRFEFDVRKLPGTLNPVPAAAAPRAPDPADLALGRALGGG